MNANEIHKMSQTSADIREHFIPLIYSFYKKCIEEGFDKEQAFTLARTYMIEIFHMPSSYYHAPEDSEKG